GPDTDPHPDRNTDRRGNPDAHQPADGPGGHHRPAVDGPAVALRPSGRARDGADGVRMPRHAVPR
ncbi:hypothetical protein, partial [Streptomyces sp. WAC07061]|uniref:hypothetical protein n=1 Tax=Streptomyces sp. WAC07061 TaxID=2487410 RepID=UPI001C8D5D33